MNKNRQRHLKQINILRKKNTQCLNNVTYHYDILFYTFLHNYEITITNKIIYLLYVKVYSHNRHVCLDIIFMKIYFQYRKTKSNGHKTVDRLQKIFPIASSSFRNTILKFKKTIKLPHRPNNTFPPKTYPQHESADANKIQNIFPNIEPEEYQVRDAFRELSSS